MCTLHKSLKTSAAIFIRKSIYMYSMKPVLRTVLYEKKIVLKESVYFYIDLKKKRYTHTYGQDELKIMRNDKKRKKMLIEKHEIE